ncbi:MAG: ATP-binding protein [Chitinophagaceae bacterium]|nr:MAG: ATP-binding protein [Chitinophagaceae bacterium]
MLGLLILTLIFIHFTGKLLVLDEAHKFMDGTKDDGLSNAIVLNARMMRHDGLRLVVSTQSPEALAPELLDLSTIAVMHQFNSRSWFKHLASKLPLESEAFERIMSLERGEALVFARRHSIQPLRVNDDLGVPDMCLGRNIFPISIRPRITCDYGASKTNSHVELIAAVEDVNNQQVQLYSLLVVLLVQ